MVPEAICRLVLLVGDLGPPAKLPVTITITITRNMVSFLGCNAAIVLPSPAHQSRSLSTVRLPQRSPIPLPQLSC